MFFTLRALDRSRRDLKAEVSLLEKASLQGMSLSGDWIWTIDRDAHFVSSNASVMNFLGYAVEDLIGRDSVSSDDARCGSGGGS